MKRLILHVLILVLLLMGLPLIGEYASWADESTYYYSDLSEDPNDPQPESGFIDDRIVYLSEDHNEEEGEDNSPE